MLALPIFDIEDARKQDKSLVFPYTPAIEPRLDQDLPGSEPAPRGRRGARLPPRHAWTGSPKQVRRRRAWR